MDAVEDAVDVPHPGPRLDRDLPGVCVCVYVEGMDGWRRWSSEVEWEEESVLRW